MIKLPILNHVIKDKNLVQKDNFMKNKIQIKNLKKLYKNKFSKDKNGKLNKNNHNCFNSKNNNFSK
jgi:hypothetical protein